ncbi:MAG: orotate phosphoribosyltransferase [Promethearchaeota archaeon]
MSDYKKDLLDNLIESKSLKIAQNENELFTFKSGRVSPNFINTGSLIQGKSVSVLKKALGNFIASLLKEGKIEDFDFIFGPAYKGINLACLACEGLYELHGINKRYLYDRKEEKAYGDVKSDKIIVGGSFFQSGQKILMIDDVITTGGTKFEAIEKLNVLGEHKIIGLVLVADRQEKMGDAETIEEMSAVEHLEEKYGIRAFAILTMEEIFSMVKDKISEPIKNLWIEYFEKYGVIKLK